MNEKPRLNAEELQLIALFRASDERTRFYAMTVLETFLEAPVKDRGEQERASDKMTRLGWRVVKGVTSNDRG